MKIIKNIFHGLFILLLLAVIALFIVPDLSIGNKPEIKIVKSGSMEPAIRTGSIVITKPEAVYNVGDIVTFGEDKNGSIPTTHRIVAIRNEGDISFMTTKGDANPKIDPEETNTNEIIGKVIFTLPYAGYILDFARQPKGFILLIGIPAGVVILYEMIGIVEEVRKLIIERKKRKA